METALVIIGYTQSERTLRHDPTAPPTRDYIPACDGWRAGARQEFNRPFAVNTADHFHCAEDILEGVFIATNAPMDAARSDPRGRVVYDELARVGWQRAVSMGDTIRVVWVQGEQVTDETYACESVSWTLIDKGSAA